MSAVHWFWGASFCFVLKLHMQTHWNIWNHRFFFDTKKKKKWWSYTGNEWMQNIEVLHVFQLILWFLCLFSLPLLLLTHHIQRVSGKGHPPKGLETRLCPSLPVTDLYLPVVSGSGSWFHIRVSIFLWFCLLMATCGTTSWFFWTLAFLLGCGFTSFLCFGSTYDAL